MTYKSQYAAGSVIALGAILGAIFGVLAGNVGAWLAIGVAIGIAIGVWVQKNKAVCPECAAAHKGHSSRD